MILPPRNQCAPGTLLLSKLVRFCLMHRPMILASSIMLGIAGPAFAQGDMAAMSRTAGANQLGILEYCQGRGDVGADAVDAQREAIARMPASAVPTAAAEASGKGGTLLTPNGQQMTVASVASQQNSTVSAVCKQLGNSAIQAAAMFKQLGSGAPSGMPGMPGGTGMPAMPRMPGGAPSLGTMPAMPGGPAR